MKMSHGNIFHFLAVNAQKSVDSTRNLEHLIAVNDPDFLVVSEPGRISPSAFRSFFKIHYPNLLILLNPHKVNYVSHRTVFVSRVGCIENDVRIVNVTVCLNDVLCHLIGAYGPTLGHGARADFWKIEKEIEKNKSAPCCVLGDLNALENEDEAIGLVHAKELVQPCLKKWTSDKILFDLWRWQGKKEGPDAITRAKPDNPLQGSRIDRFLLSSHFSAQMKTSEMRVIDWGLSDHKALFWQIDLLEDSDWAATIAKGQKKLNLRRWDDTLHSRWLKALTPLQPKFSSFDGDFESVRCLFSEMRNILYSLLGVGCYISAKQKRLKKALKERKWELAEKMKREMKMDQSELIRGRKAGKITRELFALKKDDKWVQGGELDAFVASQMPSFGAHTTPREGWGRLGIGKLREESREEFNPPRIEAFSSALKQFKKNKSVRNGLCYCQRT